MVKMVGKFSLAAKSDVVLDTVSTESFENKFSVEQRLICCG